MLGDDCTQFDRDVTQGNDHGRFNEEEIEEAQANVADSDSIATT